jgi:hypothetical protein
MNEHEYGPKYPPGEPVFVEEFGWAEVTVVTWEEDKWVYTVEQPHGDIKIQFKVEEWQILV